MSILISSDWHFSDAVSEGYRFKAIEHWVPRFIKEHEVKLLLFLGDVCEAKDEHRAELVNSVVDVFHRISELCPIVALQGNHDWFSSPENPYFGFLSRLEGIVWVAQPIDLRDLSPLLSKGSRAILLPHSADYRRDWDDIEFKAYDWAFAHQSFAGAATESGFVLPGGVPLSYFPSSLQIVSGDIHRPQSFQNLTYVGAPYPIDFGDAFEPRMLLLKDGKLRSLPCPGPAKRLLDIKSLSELRKASLTKGDLVKVRVELSSEEASNWPEMLAEIRAWGEKAGVVVHLAKPVLKGHAQSMSLAKAETKSDAELLTEYGSARGVSSVILKAGLRLL